jgi:hypothetical protein
MVVHALLRLQCDGQQQRDGCEKGSFHIDTFINYPNIGCKYTTKSRIMITFALFL